jgi:hypothetical protein
MVVSLSALGYELIARSDGEALAVQAARPLGIIVHHLYAPRAFGLFNRHWSSISAVSRGSLGRGGRRRCSGRTVTRGRRRNRWHPRGAAARHRDGILGAADFGAGAKGNRAMRAGR